MLQGTQTTNALLAVIAVALVTIAVRPYVQPAPVQAQTASALAASVDPLFVEPGVVTLKVPDGGQMLGKVVTNLRTGFVWGFPLGSFDPYPVSPLDGKPLVAHPVPLGRYALGDVLK